MELLIIIILAILLAQIVGILVGGLFGATVGFFACVKFVSVVIFFYIFLCHNFNRPSIFVSFKLTV